MYNADLLVNTIIARADAWQLAGISASKDAQQRGALTATIADWLDLHHIRYQRDYDLPRLIPLWESDANHIDPDQDFIADPHKALFRTHDNAERLSRHLRACRRLAESGSWRYDISRHMQMLTALHAEDAIAIWMARKIEIESAA